MFYKKIYVIFIKTKNKHLKHQLSIKTFASVFLYMCMGKKKVFFETLISNIILVEKIFYFISVINRKSIND